MVLMTLMIAVTLQTGVVRDSMTSHHPRDARRTGVDSAAGTIAPLVARGGTDLRGVPLYTSRTFTAHERDLLRRAFGVTDPELLYLADSTPLGILKVDTKRKTCRTCYVDSYRLGFVSLRRPGESWQDFASRMRAMPARAFPSDAHRVYRSLDDLDPEARPAFTALLRAARGAGFRVTVGATYRTPAREALLFSRGNGTLTATSMHSYGRAVDFVLDGGSASREEWTRFRRLVLAQPGSPFRLLGEVGHTWDWGHVEMPASWLGFHSIDDAIRFAGQCTLDSAGANPPAVGVGGAVRDPCAIVPHTGR